MRRRDIPGILLASAAQPVVAGELARTRTSDGLGPHYPITFAEQSAGAMPVNYNVAPPYPERYGAAGDGISNDQAALEHCLAANNCVCLSGGRTYLINGLTLNKPNATIRG